jgi:hypothetical protein
MLATLGGFLALTLGVAVLVLPVLVSELSRPRDSAWGAVVLLLGLVLVTSADRLTGSPMLAVVCGGLLIGRLGSEVGLARWRQLTPEEQQRLGSAERWRDGLGQLGASLAGLTAVAGERLAALGGALGGLGGGLATGRKPKGAGKRWVRPEPAAEPGASPPAPQDSPGSPPAAEEPEEAVVAVVRDFSEIDERLAAAQDQKTPTVPTAAMDDGALTPDSEAEPPAAAVPEPPEVLLEEVPVEVVGEAAPGEAG